MDSVLKSIKALNGVFEVCIYRETRVLGTTFPKNQRAAISASVPMLEQIFAALATIQQQHDELYIEVEDKLLVAYRLVDCCTVLLLTEKKVNFPLIHMGVKSAASKLRAMVQETLNPPPATSVNTASRYESRSRSKASTARQLPTSSSLQAVLDQWRILLFDYFGPVAELLLNDALYSWRQSTDGEYQHLSRLLNLLLAEFDSPTEMQAFRKQARAAMHNM